MFGETPEAVGSIWRIISEYAAYVDPSVEAFILPLYFGRHEEDAEQIRRAVTALGPELERLDGALVRSSYLAGDAPSAADFVVFPHVRSILRASSKEGARAFDVPFLPLAERHPAIEAWIERIEQLPATKDHREAKEQQAQRHEAHESGKRGGGRCAGRSSC